MRTFLIFYMRSDCKHFNSDKADGHSKHGRNYSVPVNSLPTSSPECKQTVKERYPRKRQKIKIHFSTINLNATFKLSEADGEESSLAKKYYSVGGLTVCTYTQTCKLKRDEKGDMFTNKIFVGGSGDILPQEKFF